MKNGLLFLLVMLSALRMLAQSNNDVSISVTVAPPYSPYISDYYDLLGEGIIVLTNLTQETRSVKIVGRLERDGQLLGSTSPTYQPSSPIVLGPLETRVINASQENQAFFDDQNMDFFVDRNTIITVAQTGILPEGNYSICLQALDYFTNFELSPAFPGGCTYLPILYVQPPITASPLCNDTITVLNNIASFAWLPVTAPTTQPMLYDLYIVKMLMGVNPNDAIMGAINYGAGNPIIKTNLVTTGITTLPSDLPIEAGNWYAWCVVAHDPTNEVHIENNGRSEVCTFYAGQPQTASNTLPATIDPNLPTFQLLPFATLSGNIRYKFHGDSFVNASTLSSVSSSFSNISTYNNWYGNVGSASGSGGTTTTPTFGGGGIELDPSTLPDIIDTYAIMGTGLAQPPASLLPENYLNLGGLPLQNAGLVFTSRFAVGKSLNVQSIEDLQIIRPNGGDVYFSANGGPLTNAGYAYQTAGSTSTNQYGDYSLTLVISQPYGLLQSGAITAQCGGGEFVDSYSGYGLYRLLTIEITDPRYCHPDVYLFPQPNQGLEIPQQVVKVKSYNLNVEVKSNGQAAQQAGANSPIANAVVRVGRIAEELENFPASYPQGESNIGSFGYSMSEAIPNIIQCDSVVTNASGIATLKRLVRSTGSCNMTGETGYTSNVTLNDAYYIEAFTHEFIGTYNYHKKRVYRFAPCADGMGLHYDQHGVRSHEYTPPVHTLQIVLTPKDPEIYVTVRTDYGSGPVPVPNTNLLFEIKKPVSPTISWQMYQTDENGLFKKQITSGDYYGGFAWKSASGVFQSQYIVTAAKTGYEVLNCNGCSASGQHVALQMGQRWTPEVNMKPKGNVKGIVRDEDGNPIQGEVKIGEGVFMPLEMAFTYVASNLNLNGSPTTTSSTLFNSTTSSFSGLLSSSTPTYGSTTTTYSVNANYTTTNTSLSGTTLQSGISGTATNAMFSNESVFDFPAQSGNDIMLIVRPSSTSLFVDTFYVDIPVNATTAATNLGIFIVKKKLHRPVITVRSAASALASTPVTGASVTLSDLPTATTNTQGVASFLFGSPASEFRLQIQKNGFAQYDEHIVIPVSKNPYPITITLAPGYSVSGTVTNEVTGAPIPNARVYCVTGTNAFGSITVETQTNNLGQYTLNNLPGGWRVLKAAASSSDVTYLVESIMRVLPVTTPVNFTLLPAPFHLPNIWDFPAEIASFAPIAGGWNVSGALTSITPNSRFKMERSNQRLNFTNLPITANGEGNNAAGQPIAQPSVDEFSVNENQVRAILNDRHILSLSGVLSGGAVVSYTYFTGLAPMMLSKIKIQKNTSTGNGEMKCRAYTLLESFRMTYNYDGQFYLGETPNSSSISAFKAGPSPTMPETYFLMNTNSLGTAINPEYTVHEFPAYADRSASYVRGDSLILATRLIIDIPLSNPEEIVVDAGKIIVLPEEIQILSGSQALNFDLEEWHVETNSWTFDEAYGGIITSGTIETNTIDFAAPIIIMRPNQLILPNASTISTSDLTISGITPFKVNSGTSLSFGYYEAPAHDPSRGHWRIALFNPELPAGYIEGLPGWNSGVKLNFSYLENFSDGHLQFSVAPNQSINHYNVINQQVTGLTKLTDGFSLDGPIDLSIPNLGNGYSLNVVYFKQDGVTKVRLNGLYTTFETYGQVQFKGDQQTNRISLDWNSLKVPGLMTIYDDATSNVISLRAMLEKTPSQSRIDIMKLDAEGIMPGTQHQYIDLGGGSDGKQKILEGTQLTQSSSWAPLSYHAQFIGYTGSMQEGSDKMWFTVSGAIQNDVSKSEPLELTSIETPFGDLALTYHFDLMEIRGVINFGNIPFGSVNINNGSAQFGMGGRGFFFVAEMNATYPTIGVLQTNMITGWYPEISSEASTKLKTGMYIKKLPEFMNEGIQGLYMCANKELIHTDFEIDFGLFGGGLYINTGMDLRFWMNFGESYGGAHFGALAYCDAEIYAHVLHICEACFGLLAEVGLETDFQYNPSTDFSVSICGTLGMNISFCDISWSESAKVSGTLSSANGAQIDVSFGETCGNPMPTNSNGCKHF